MLETRSEDDEQRPLLQSEQTPYNTNYERIQGNESREDPTMGVDTTSAQIKRLPQYIATIAATTGALAAGCVLGWSSPAESAIVKYSVYGFPVNNEQWSWIGSIATVGAIISCLMIGFVMDMFGRKFTMLLLIIPFSIGWANIIWPVSVVMLGIGRFFSGFSGGAFFVVGPCYLGEIASKDIRGTLASCLQLMITAGILFVYVIGHFFALNSFHTFNTICAILPLIFGVAFVWCPESPHYYVMKNRTEDARESLKWLRGNDYNFNDEINEIQLEHDLMTRNRTTFFAALKKPATKRALMITLILVFLTQMSGINAVIFYTASIFQEANVPVESSVAAIIVGIMQVVATFVATFVVDKLGRRPLLALSSSVMCICNIGLGAYFFLLDHNSAYINYLGWLPISSLCVYIIAFSLGLGPLPWVLVSEIFTTEVKAIASSLSGATSWFIAFLVTKFFSNVRDLVGAGPTFLGFAAFAIVCTVFVLTTVPETKGKSFQEIQATLHSETDNIDEADDDNTTITNASQNTIAI